MEENTIKINQIETIKNYSEELYDYITSDKSDFKLNGNKLQIPYLFFTEGIDNLEEHEKSNGVLKTFNY